VGSYDCLEIFSFSRSFGIKIDQLSRGMLGIFKNFSDILRILKTKNLNLNFDEQQQKNIVLYFFTQNTTFV
jgi:hypothetical protein